MPGPLLIPLIAAGAALGGAGINAYSSRKNTERTIAGNMELARYQYEMDKQMWHEQNAYNAKMWDKQNAYNSPEAQMARLKAAGLNPNMVYGAGTVQGNSTSIQSSAPMPRFQAPTVDYRGIQPFQIPDLISAYQDYQVRKAQIDNLEANAENTRARTLNESIRSFLLDVQGKRADVDLDTAKQMQPYQLEVAKGSARKQDAEVSQEFQKVIMMQHDTLNKYLESRYREKNLSIQDIEAEKKAAELLFQKYRNDWMKMGITTSDNPVLRILARMANETGLVDGVNKLFGK